MCGVGLRFLFYPGTDTKMRKDVDMKTLAQGLWSQLVAYSKKAGRAGTRIVLKFFYVMQYGDLTATERAMVYAGLVYIIVPRDLLPRRFLKWFGVLDDVGVAAWIFNRIGRSITPEIERRVEATLDRWFGPVVTISATE